MAASGGEGQGEEGKGREAGLNDIAEWMESRIPPDVTGVRVDYHIGKHPCLRILIAGTIKEVESAFRYLQVRTKTEDELSDLVASALGNAMLEAQSEQPIQVVDNPDFSALIKACQRYVQDFVDGDRGDDAASGVFDSAMKVCFGRDVFPRISHERQRRSFNRQQEKRQKTIDGRLPHGS